MKIPKKINVLGVPYKIVLKDKLIDPQGNISESHVGWCNEGKGTIEIATSNIFCERLREQTLFHELTHAIMYESGISRKIDDGDNEIFAQIFGNAMHQIFKQVV